MFRSSIMWSDWWKCGKYALSRFWGVHMFYVVGNILGTSYSTWWHVNQKYEADCCKICTHLLKDDQKQNQLALCKGLQDQAKNERGFHSKFRAGDENWVYGYDPGTKQQSSQWKSHPTIQESWDRWSQTSRARCLFFWTVRQFFRRRSFFYSASLWIKSST